MPEGRMITEAGTRELTATLGALALALPLWISGCERHEGIVDLPVHSQLAVIIRLNPNLAAKQCACVR